MTPAELRTVRESLCITQQWVADKCEVSVEKVQDWETDKRRVPVEVENLILSVEEMLWAHSEEVAEYIDSLSKKKATLLRYKNDDDLLEYGPDMLGLPANCHAQMLHRVSSLVDDSIECRIVYFEPEEYFDWLGDRENTAENRAKWTSHQPTFDENESVQVEM